MCVVIFHNTRDAIHSIIDVMREYPRILSIIDVMSEYPRILSIIDVMREYPEVSCLLYFILKITLLLKTGNNGQTLQPLKAIKIANVI